MDLNAPDILDRQRQRPRRRFTLDEVLRMVDVGVIDRSEKLELIDGDLIEMSPQGLPHLNALTRLNRHFVSCSRPEVNVVPQSTMRLGPYFAPEPDLWLFNQADDYAALTGAKILLVIEISDTSLATDLGRKAEDYARHGIPEYWVLDVHTREVHIHRDPTEGVYPPPYVARPDEMLTPRAVPECALRMDRWSSFTS